MSQKALSRKVNGNGNVILDTHPESYQHQNWTCSTGSPPGPTHQIWWWYMNPFLRYLADKNSAHRYTDTRRWPQDLAAYGAQVTKASSHEGQCIPAGCSVSPSRRVWITVSIITMRHFPGYFRQILRPIVYALHNFERNFPILVASPTDASAKCLMRCKAYLVP